VTAPEDLAQSAIYRHPSDTLFGRMLPRLLHAPRWTRLRRALSRRWPMPALVSDVRDVVYVSWWVDVRHARCHHQAITTWSMPDARPTPSSATGTATSGPRWPAAALADAVAQAEQLALVPAS
jgi:hypothetical protein